MSLGWFAFDASDSGAVDRRQALVYGLHMEKRSATAAVTTLNLPSHLLN